MILTLPNEIINEIIKYIIDIDSLKLLQTCKTIYIIMKNNGFLKSLMINKEKTINEIDILCHLNTLMYIMYYDVDRIYNNIWVNQMSFILCNIENINPLYKTKTKILLIYSNYYYIINIDWEKFPDLEFVYIDAYDVINIEKCNLYCKKLKIKCINSRK